METAARQFRKRNAILSCLQQTDLHPSAEMVYAMLRQDHSDISLATVYRNLSRFKSQGLIRSLGTVDGTERFDPITKPHVHFVCNQCGALMDLPQMDPPQQLCQEAAQQMEGQVDSCQLMFYGTCRNCLSKKA